MKARIETKLREAFSPSSLTVEDDSHLHVNHGNYRPGGGSHFRVRVVSSAFTSCSRIERHRQVHACLEGELNDGVHALCLTLLSPEEEASILLV